MQWNHHHCHYWFSFHMCTCSCVHVWMRLQGPSRREVVDTTIDVGVLKLCQHKANIKKYYSWDFFFFSVGGAGLERLVCCEELWWRGLESITSVNFQVSLMICLCSSWSLQRSGGWSRGWETEQPVAGSPFQLAEAKQMAPEEAVCKTTSHSHMAKEIGCDTTWK